MPITPTILRVSERDPDQLAIVGADGRLTYAELVQDARRMFAAVSALHDEQQHPPTPVPETLGIPITAVSVTSAFHTSRIIAGLAGYRAISATIDPRWPLEHRVGVIMATGIGVVVSDADDLAEELARRGWGGTIISLARLRQLEAASAPAESPAVRSGDEPFLLLFSSGTTSNPKAFLKTRDQYRANLAISTAHLEPFAGVATLAPGPVSYSLTLYALIECLATGGSAHMSDAFEPARIGQRVTAEQITRVVAVPAIVQALADAARRNPTHFDSLELLVTGGANLAASVRNTVAQTLPKTRLISYYGAAEIGFIGDSRDGDGTLISIYDGVAAEIRDATGNRTADGELGTLWVHTPACSDGYIAGTTDATLRGDDGWGSVGDQGRIIDGHLELVGRADDIAVTGGHKVALPEVERAFDDFPGAGSVCAIALEHPRLGSVVALVIETAASDLAKPDQPQIEATALTKDALQQHARERLAPQFVPRRWYRIPQIPRTVGGKIRRRATADAVLAGEAERL